MIFQKKLNSCMSLVLQKVDCTTFCISLLSSRSCTIAHWKRSRSQFKNQEGTSKIHRKQSILILYIKKKKTALHLACIFDKQPYPLVNLLISSGADLNIQDDSKRVPKEKKKFLNWKITQTISQIRHLCMKLAQEESNT